MRRLQPPWLLYIGLVACGAAPPPPSMAALDPAVRISQYAHTLAGSGRAARQCAARPGPDHRSIDPGHLALDDAPPAVHVEQLIADRRAYGARDALQLPALTHEIQLDYGLGRGDAVGDHMRTILSKLSANDRTHAVTIR